MYVTERFVRVSPDDFVSGTNQAVSINYVAPGLALHHCISGVAWSFDVAPAQPTALTIMDGGNVVFEVDVAAAGPGSILFDPAKQGSVNGGMTVTLGAGGPNVVGKLNVSHWVE